MIERYTRPELARVWSEENKYKIWLQVEIALCEALASLRKIPRKSLAKIKQRAKINIKKIQELDKKVHHDVIAFLTSLTEKIGPDGRFLHMGMTSSDLVDTGIALLLKEASQEILKGLDKLLLALKKRALKYKNTVCIGRTHGVHAEPTTFGLKLLNFYDELNRTKEKFECAIDEINVGMFSGAVGTYSNISPKVEIAACKKLKLKPAKISTQIISRDRHAYYLAILSLIASVIEKIATEIRHLQRTEVLEVEEPFYKNQKGSSSMPHKRNPWRSENLCGLARLVRSYSFGAMGNISLWHERDISHSSVERVILPDSTVIVDFMLDRMETIISDLNVYPENMKENMNKFGGVVFSQNILLKLVEKGLEREKAYKIVQRNSHKAWNKKDGNFKKNLLSDNQVLKYVTVKDIEGCFNPKNQLNHVEMVYKKVLR